jgi:hypothetical protein
MGEALGRKSKEERFQKLLEWSVQRKSESYFTPNELERLKHAVAVQCEERNCMQIGEIDFEIVSSSFLPHRSGEVLKAQYTEVCRLVVEEEGG